MSWFSSIDWGKGIRSFVGGLIGGAVAAIGTGHLNPVTIGQAAVLGGAAKGLGFLENPFAPDAVPTTQQIVQQATAGVQAVVNTEINKAVPAIAQTVVRHLADQTINNVATQIAGQPVRSAIPVNVPSAPRPVAAPPTPIAPTGLTASEWAQIQQQRQQQQAAAPDGPPSDAPPSFQAPGS